MDFPKIDLEVEEPKTLNTEDVEALIKRSDNGDDFSCYNLGNMYLKGDIVNKNLNKAERYLLSAKNNKYAQYALGNLYLQKEKYDIKKAILCFEKSADKNMQASYLFGRIYFFSADDLKKDREKALEFMNLSAKQGNEYAQNFIDNTEGFENKMLVNTLFSLFVNLSRCIEDDYHYKFQSGRKMIVNKLQKFRSKTSSTLKATIIRL